VARDAPTTAEAGGAASRVEDGKIHCYLDGALEDIDEIVHVVFDLRYFEFSGVCLGHQSSASGVAFCSISGADTGEVYFPADRDSERIAGDSDKREGRRVFGLVEARAVESAV